MKFMKSAYSILSIVASHFGNFPPKINENKHLCHPTNVDVRVCASTSTRRKYISNSYREQRNSFVCALMLGARKKNFFVNEIDQYGNKFTDETLYTNEILQVFSSKDLCSQFGIALYSIFSASASPSRFRITSVRAAMFVFVLSPLLDVIVTSFQTFFEFFSTILSAFSSLLSLTLSSVSIFVLRLENNVVNMHSNAGMVSRLEIPRT